jgi:hypothetical protein
MIKEMKMKKTFLTSVALASTLAFSPTFAGEKPTQLSAAQMDNVTAGSRHPSILQDQFNFAIVEQNQACLVCVGVGGSGQVQFSEVIQINEADASIRGRRR